MTTMQGYVSGQESPLDELPAWKRELILRKRANTRIHGGIGLPTPTPPMAGRGRSSLSGRTQPTSSSVSGPNQAASRSLSGPSTSHPQQSAHANNAVSSRLDGVEGSVSAGGERNESKRCAVVSEVASVSSNNMHHKGLYDEGPRVASPTYSSLSDAPKDEDEELSYGPGIVSKLKNRYMSLAMRESRSRPSLRRFSSLEDLLDTEPGGAWQAPGGTTAAGRMPRPAAPSQAHRRDMIKRARSVDSLSSRLGEEARGGRPAMPKSTSASSRLQSSLNALAKDVVIIETSRPVPEHKGVNGAPRQLDEPPPLTRKTSSSSLAEEDEMPPPDTVRHVKRMFEPTSGRQVRGAAARVAAHKAQQAKTNGVAKPALKAKPTVVPPKTASPPFPITIEEAKSSLRQVGPVARVGPRPTLSVRPTTHNGQAADTQNGVVSRVRPGLTPVTASVTAPMVNGEAQRKGDAVEVGEGLKRVSASAVANIRKDSTTHDFNFTKGGHEAPKEVAKDVGKEAGRGGRPASPTPTQLPASPPASHRVPTHSPLAPKAERHETDIVLQENLKNVEKSRPRAPATTVEPRRLEPKAEAKGLAGKGTKVEAVAHTRVEAEPKKVSPDVSEAPKWSPKKTTPQRPGEPKGETLKSPVEELVRSSGKGALVEAVNKTGAAPSSPAGLKSAGHRDNWHQQDNNTIVFNFTSSSKSTPDYIENDGVDLSKRRPEAKQLESGYVIMPGWSGDSSTDADEDEDLGSDYLDAPRPGVLPAPSGIVFEGEGVIINGRSNLQRQPKTRKLNLTFHKELTSTFEYPSEASLLEDTMHDALANTHDSSASQGGLASYTPSKIQLGSTFELGVSRTPPPSAPPPAPSAAPEGGEEDYLRPADESETVHWSAESTSDMLF